MVFREVFMKVLLFTHKNDIDGMGNAILSKENIDQFIEKNSIVDSVVADISSNM